MNKLMTKISALVALMTLALLAGCSGMGSKVGDVMGLDTDIVLELSAEGDINPDERGNASPLIIRLYELKSPKLFDTADFIELYDRDKKVLGQDFVGMEKLKRLRPGEDRGEKFVLNEETRYIALYAEFFQFNDSSYKVIVPIKTNNLMKNVIKIRISGNKLILEK